MRVRDWRRPARHLVVLFLAVAVVSAASLGWLGWQLLCQDRALELQRRQEELERSADRAVASVRQALADLPARLQPSGSERGSLPLGLTLVTVRPAVVTVRQGESLPYYPVRQAAEARPETFAEGERLEHARRDPAAAARRYARLARSDDAAVRAGALARLGRVRRKLHDLPGALAAYDALGRIEGVDVGGLPAGLVARTGRAGALEEAGRLLELPEEAEALRREVADGRWPLSAPEHDFYLNRAEAWLGTGPERDTDGRARADAVGWLWRNRASLEPAARRGLVLPDGPAFLAWQADTDSLDAVVAGPAYLSDLCRDSVADTLRCSLGDTDGRAVEAGHSRVRRVAVRAASTDGLPWTLAVSAPDGTEGLPPSPRHRLLVAVLAVVGLVLAAGWYFILRATSREMRVARMQSDFVAAVSHEFRTPLTSITHVAEMLASGRLVAGDLQRRSFDVIVRDAHRLRRLVEDLLDLGRFEAGAVALPLEPLDVPALVRATVEDFRERAGPGELAVELDLPVESIVAKADREALSRALWNLLDNAVKYSPDCSTVWVRVEERDGRVRIVVRDRGLGIPARERRDIFDRFVRGAESRARRIGGTGVGLAMVREIVRAHRGEIELESEPGRGSAFAIVLPVAPQEALANGTVGTPARSGGPAPRPETPDLLHGG